MNPILISNSLTTNNNNSSHHQNKITRRRNSPAVMLSQSSSFEHQQEPPSISSMNHHHPQHEIMGDDDDNENNLNRDSIMKVKDNNSNSSNSSTNLPSWFVVKVTTIASLGGILFGYDLGVISGALPQLITAFDLSQSQQECVVSILYVGGGLGAALGGSLCDAFGRKRAILMTDIVFLMGAVILATAPTYGMVLLGRIVVGFGVAVSGIADVSYLHEMAPPQWRGAIVSVNEACISLGFLLAFAIGCLLSYEGNDSGWRTMFGLSGVVAMIQFCGMIQMPESPTWLKECGRLEESEDALRRIHSSSSLMRQQQYQQQEQKYDSSDGGSLTDMATRSPSSDSHDESVVAPLPQPRRPLPAAPRSAMSRVAVYDTLTTSDASAVVVPPSPLSANGSAAATATTTTTTLPPQHNSSSSISLNSLTPFCTTNAAESPPSSSMTRRRRRSSVAVGGRLQVLWSRLSRYSRQFLYLLAQMKAFCISTMTLYRQQAYIALFLSITQQLCGQTNVLSYAPLIFANLLLADEDNDNADMDLASMQAWATVSIGVVKFIVTVLVIWKIETLGRRFLLLTGMFTIAVGLILLTIAFGGAQFVHNTRGEEEGQQQHENANGNSSEVVVEDHHLGGFYLAVPGVLLVVCGYSMSFGPLTWLLTSELFPTDIRGRALGASTIVTYTTAVFVTSTFLSSQEWLGSTSLVFALYLLVTALGFLFAFMAIPDTKEKSVQEIQNDMNGMIWWRSISTTSTTTAATSSSTTDVASTQYHNAQHDAFTGLAGGGGRRQQQRQQPQHEKDMILT